MYMQLMLHHARQNGAPITRETLRDHGREVALFEGLKDLSWFERMNAFGARYDLDIEHYIVSAGLEEMIEGTPIRPALLWNDARAHAECAEIERRVEARVGGPRRRCRRAVARGVIVAGRRFRRRGRRRRLHLRAARGAAGRMPPTGFPRDNRF